ncbi:hypothetical protein LTR16_010783, partial [Cryomyces antarcticus]
QQLAGGGGYSTGFQYGCLVYEVKQDMLGEIGTYEFLGLEQGWFGYIFERGSG